MTTNLERAWEYLNGVSVRSWKGGDVNVDTLATLLDEAEKRGAEKERERIVAWLRGPLSGDEAADIANAIERGEHEEGGT